MAERPRIDSKTAYQIAHEQFQQPSCRPWELKQKFPKRFFRYDEDGYGILMTRGYAYVASGYADDIRRHEGTIRIKDGWLEGDYKSVYLDSRIPEKDINAVMRFAKRAVKACQETRKEPQASK